jgi:hypothetical protein
VVALFVAGSALPELAWSAGSLILFRVLQGLGGGMMMPSAPRPNSTRPVLARGPDVASTKAAAAPPAVALPVSAIGSHANAVGGKSCASTKAGLAGRDPRDPRIRHLRNRSGRRPPWRRERPVCGPALPREEEPVLTRCWLTLADASGESRSPAPADRNDRAATFCGRGPTPSRTLTPETSKCSEEPNADPLSDSNRRPLPYHGRTGAFRAFTDAH